MYLKLWYDSVHVTSRNIKIGISTLSTEPLSTSIISDFNLIKTDIPYTTSPHQYFFTTQVGGCDTGLVAEPPLNVAVPYTLSVRLLIDALLAAGYKVATTRVVQHLAYGPNLAELVY